MPEISLMPSIGISASGLDAETTRMEVIANNVANAQTTRDANGKVYHRQEVVFAARLDQAIHSGGSGKRPSGVQVQKIVDDKRPLVRDYRPGNPDADENGYVTLPNVNTLEEMVDMMSSSRAYEANLAAVKTARSMASQALDILK
jgi:flagellar basal-body rod protein FlgC